MVKAHMPPAGSAGAASAAGGGALSAASRASNAANLASSSRWRASASSTFWFFERIDVRFAASLNLPRLNEYA